jgi:hypothetical protein
MNLTYGDLIIVEIALVSYMKDLDLSMQSGQYISELLGKVEYQLAQLRAGAEHTLGPGIPPPPAQPNVGPTK